MTIRPIPYVKGSLIAGLTADLVAEAPEFLLQLAEEHGEIVLFKMFGKRFVVVASPDLIREVLVTQYETFPKDKRDAEIMRRFLGNGLVPNRDIAFHRKQRKLAQPAFHMRRIATYADVMVDYTDRVIDTWHDGEVRDISKDMMALTMFIVSKTLYDADIDEMAGQAQTIGGAIETLQELSDQEFNGLVMWPEWLPIRRNRERKVARRVMYDVIERMIAERRTADGVEDRGDLLSMLLLAQYEDGSPMPDQQVRDELVTMFAAGHETTSNALTWTWYLLSQNPDAEARLHAELDAVLGGREPSLDDLENLPYTLQVVKESMRLYPPAWILNSRVAAEATQIGPYELAQGDRIFVSPYVMHRLSRYWEQPEQFDPDRFVPENEREMSRYVYMPFGGGPRVCIGNSFAMMEAHLIVASIAQRYRFELMPDQQIELNPQVTLSNKTGMQMRVVARDVSAETPATMAAVAA